MNKRLGFAVVVAGILFCFNILADDGNWYDPLRNIISQTEYELIVDPNHFVNDGAVRDLYKKMGLRINYRFSKTNFILTGGDIRPYLQTAIYDQVAGNGEKIVGYSKTKTHYLNFKYVLWESSRSKICSGVGLSQERFRWKSGGIKQNKSFYDKSVFGENKIMPFASLSGEIKTSRHTALSLEIWRYFGKSRFPFKDSAGKEYAFGQDKTQIFFHFIFRFS